MQLTLTIVLTALSIFVIGTHAVIGKTHFKSKQMPPGANLVTACVLGSLALFLVLLWTNTPPVPALAIGIVLEAVALWMFHRTVAASREGRLKFAFDVENPETLVTSGPYRYVRHPFYTSYLIFWTGLAIACWTLWGFAILVLMAILYTVAARAEERKFGTTAMADDYVAYRARTGMFFPRLGGK